jgi:hypothetical protein
MAATSSGDAKVVWYSGMEPLQLELYGGKQLSVSTPANKV